MAVLRNNIRAVRAARRMSGTRVGKRIGKNPQFIYQLASSQKGIPQKLLPKLYEILQATPNEIPGVPEGVVLAGEIGLPYLAPNALPILAAIWADQPILAQQNIVGCCVPPEGFSGDFWLIVEGEQHGAALPRR